MSYVRVADVLKRNKYNLTYTDAILFFFLSITDNDLAH